MSTDKKKEIFGYIESLVFAAIGVVVLLTFVFRLVVVDGTSMNPTLQNADKIITVTVYGTPKQGDVVVLDSELLGKNLVKRVIANEGQTVDISIDGTVLVDGVRLDEEYIAAKIDGNHRGKVEFPYTVGKGCVFVLGDNRNASNDSRYFGEVDCNAIVGKAVLRLAPAFGAIK